jgi:hypothetical protein
MEGDTHAATGGAMGLLIAPELGLHTLTTALPFAVITAGYALVPDLDHPGAAASRLLGPVTEWVCRRLCSLSAWTFRHTKTRHDVPAEGTHRHLTHTLAFALVLGGLAHLSAGWGGARADLGWLAFGLLLAVDRLGAVAAVAYASVLLAWLPLVSTALSGHTSLGQGLSAAITHTTPWLGVAVALGCLTHDLGDMLTWAGVPVLAPLPLGNQRWRRLHLLPKRLRFRTGKIAERRLVLPASVLIAILAMPGVLPVLSTGYQSLLHATSHHS